MKDLNFDQFAEWLEGCDAVEVDGEFITYPPVKDDEEEEILFYKSEEDGCNGDYHCRVTPEWMFTVGQVVVTATDEDGTTYEFARLKRC